MASAIVAKLATLKKKQADIQKEMATVAKAAFKEMSAGVFKANPALVSFGWSQYTPYWNDGDTCEFSANGEYPSITFTAPDGKTVRHNENSGELTEVGTAQWDEDVEIESDVELDPAPYEKQVDKLSKAVSKFLGNFSDDDFLTMFDDHVQVTVNRNGKVEVEDFEHE
jgi:hypothetical protein